MSISLFYCLFLCKSNGNWTELRFNEHISRWFPQNAHPHIWQTYSVCIYIFNLLFDSICKKKNVSLLFVEVMWPNIRFIGFKRLIELLGICKTRLEIQRTNMKTQINIRRKIKWISQNKLMRKRTLFLWLVCREFTHTINWFALQSTNELLFLFFFAVGVVMYCNCCCIYVHKSSIFSKSQPF